MSQTQLLLLIAFLIYDISAASWAGTATHYTFPSGGNSCMLGSWANGMCVSVSDGFSALWKYLVPSGTKCDYKPDWQNCATCETSAALPHPGCPFAEMCYSKTGQSQFLCVKCTDTTPGACKHNNFVRVYVADACPSHHQCNTCKGTQNPCLEGRPHIDLCDNAFWNIAYKQPTASGLNVLIQDSGC